MTEGDPVEIIRGPHKGLQGEIIEADNDFDGYWVTCFECEFDGYTFGPFSKKELKRISYGTDEEE